MKTYEEFVTELSNSTLKNAAVASFKRGETKRANRFLKHMKVDKNPMVDFFSKKDLRYDFLERIVSSPMNMDYDGEPRYSPVGKFSGLDVKLKAKTVGFVSNDRFFESNVGDFEFDTKVPCSCSIEFSKVEKDYLNVGDNVLAVPMILTISPNKDTNVRMLTDHGYKDFECKVGTTFSTKLYMFFDGRTMDFDTDAFKDPEGAFTAAMGEFAKKLA